MVLLIFDIFEDGNDQPVLSHIFYGASSDEVQGLLYAHATNDMFLQAAITDDVEEGVTAGEFNGMKLRGVGRIIDAGETAKIGEAIIESARGG